MADTTQTVDVTAVDGTLSFHDPSVPQGLVDAYANTLMFAQGAARAVNGDPASEEYFNTMTTELQDLGWLVTNAGTLDYKHTAEKISPAAVVKTILDPYLSSDKQAQLAGILDAIQQPDVSVKGFVDFFWSKSHTGASKANMAIGPLTSVNNASDITMIFYSFDYDATDVRSLFVEIDSASLGVTARNLEMQLNMASYETHKDALIAKISGKEDDHIANTKVSF